MIARCCVPFIAMLVVAAGPPAKDGGHDDKSKLQGEWALVSMEGPRVRLDEAQVKKSKLVVKGDVWQATINGREVVKITFEIDPAKSPKEIDLRLTRGGGEPRTLRGLYELDGDSLTVCRTVLYDGDRPKELKAGNRMVLVVYKRAEKK